MAKVYHKWKGHAKDILFNYPQNQKILKQLELNSEQIANDKRPFKYLDAISGKVQPISQIRLTEIKRETRAIDDLVEQLSTSDRVEDKEKQALLNMVYFKKSHTLYGAAQVIHVSERTIWRMNALLLQYVAQQLGWI